MSERQMQHAVSCSQDLRANQFPPSYLQARGRKVFHAHLTENKSLLPESSTRSVPSLVGGRESLETLCSKSPPPPQPHPQ
ncbi:hypothetical protein CJ030_MR5G017517 [Morella rubra]|uniref:Uncharacterized protein n=1 Tax=Morella rubra TaxID=262757 RepID=A0A6A1VPJ1_9ROSI|nr:hypothetical protein CJ030_MR5G017517 [Morella rubra]